MDTDQEPPASTTTPQPAEALQPPSEPDMIFSKGLRVAIQGCGHGALDQIYATIEQACRINNYTVDLLIICGDFQATRNSRDLLAMSVPAKYRRMCDFYKYYNGSKVAPIPTLFIGGNHEASAHLYELSLGGWAAPNMYYMGNTGVVDVNGLRIAGVSGIYKDGDYRRPRGERPPFDDRSMRSAYHYRAHELFKLNQLSGDIDIFISHDWPEGITKYGNEPGLLRVKPHFRAEVASGTLGSPPLMGMLRKLRPRYWFAAHMHIKFPAVVDHDVPVRTESAADAAAIAEWTDGLDAVESKNEDEIDLDMDDGDAPPPAPPPQKKPAPETNSNSKATQLYPSPPTANTRTRFLALDKLLPRRDFLQIVPISSPNPLPESSPNRTTIRYDREWLAITRAFEPLDVATGVGLSQYMKFAQDTNRVNKRIREEAAWVADNISDEQLLVPANWERTVELQFDDNINARRPPDLVHNPQTETFCKLIGIVNKWTLPLHLRQVSDRPPSPAGESSQPGYVE
ncbi:hypothetical protein DRE_02785 [Drechslerella stenobrocha 248]|uniref:Lariat debranching enzyme C-terminal domain-containing protein n=1 Tax=Drechslerella stenobrocha 248 TaxID=1043628 RepID=W7I6N2_9PEZI|nr:hypothetical protein DRE_02785 [Drechslerella stenobrocha 248]